MDKITLALCRCGGTGQFTYESSNTKIFVICERCKIRTPSKAAGLEYSAKQKVADIWNAGLILWPPWQQNYKYKIGDQVTSNDQQNRPTHWLNEKDENTQEPKQAGSGWRYIEPVPTL